MTTATAKPKRKSESASTQRMTVELENLKQELATCHAFLSQVQTFSDLVTTAKADIETLATKEFELKQKLSEVREDLKSLRDYVSSANDGMLAVLEPGPTEFMPMFDRMEKADPKTHGKNAGEWREQPIAKLRLSPVASSVLVDADILFIGQLQDRILDDDNWWQEVSGLTEPVAAAIADKLSIFVKKGGKA